MVKAITLTPEQRAEVDAARAHGLSWRAIAKNFGVSVDGLRRQVDPKFRIKRNAASLASPRKSRRSRRLMRGLKLPPDRSDAAPIIPPEKIERPRYTLHTDMTAILMGDPPPERSALAQRSEK